MPGLVKGQLAFNYIPKGVREVAPAFLGMRWNREFGWLFPSIDRGVVRLSGNIKEQELLRPTSQKDESLTWQLRPPLPPCIDRIATHFGQFEHDGIKNLAIAEKGTCASPHTLQELAVGPRYGPACYGLD